MNARVLLLSALLLPLGAVAAPPAGVVEYSCGEPRLPPLQAVADLYGLDNWGHAYSRRMRLMHDARHACKVRGAESLLIVSGPMGPKGERLVAMVPRR